MRKAKSQIGRQYLLKPDPKDNRDHQYSAPRMLEEIKDQVDLRDKFSPCKDQGKEGSCAAFAGCAALSFAEGVENPNSAFDFSRGVA